MLNVEDAAGGLDDELLFETIYTVLAAGVDTSTSLLSSALAHLDRNREDRQRLIEDPGLLTQACEEFLRFYSCRGDRVLVAWASANRDESAFYQPDVFVLDRKPHRHMAFGFGIHQCVGAALARQEFTTVMTEVLRRMPDYSIDRARSQTYPDVGLMYGYQSMPATFTPGARSAGS
jgi:cytochrome P450